MKLMDKFKELSPTAQGMIIIGILLIIGIILRWDEVSQGIISGFKRYSGNLGPLFALYFSIDCNLL